MHHLGQRGSRLSILCCDEEFRRNIYFFFKLKKIAVRARKVSIGFRHPSSFPFSPQALGLFSHALGSASTGFFYARCSFALGRIPFPFLPYPLLSFLHLLLIHLLSSRLFLFLPPPYHPCLRFLHHFTLFFFTFVKSHNVLCLVLS